MANLNPSTSKGNVQWKFAKQIENSYFYSMFHSCLGFGIQKSPKDVERKSALEQNCCTSNYHTTWFSEFSQVNINDNVYQIIFKFYQVT